MTFFEPRTHLCNVIKVYVDYATKQGSQSPGKYYYHYTVRINQCLFNSNTIGNIELTLLQKDNLQKLNLFVANKIQHYMDKSKPYKQIFKAVCKDIKEFKCMNITL